MDKGIDFQHLDLVQVEQLVGLPPLGVRVENGWVVVIFTTCIIRFKQW